MQVFILKPEPATNNRPRHYHHCKSSMDDQCPMCGCLDLEIESNFTPGYVDATGANGPDYYSYQVCPDCGWDNDEVYVPSREPVTSFTPEELPF